MNKFLKIYEIIRLMGPKWAINRLLYAMKLHMGILEKETPIQSWDSVSSPAITGSFFSPSVASKAAIPIADEIRTGRFTYFSHHKLESGFPPDWFANPFGNNTKTAEALKEKHWSRIPDFGNGDIKCVWEVSRFAWAYPLVQAYGASGNEAYSDTFWSLFEDWSNKNHPNRGVNWKCGQEISIRLFALVTAYFSFLPSTKTTEERKKHLRQILFASAKRIEANIGYAISQSNNHGISEASGLFTAGILFAEKKWINKASKLLENQVQELIYSDGSFSQHSANYHRVMLHACLWAAQVGRANNFEFSDVFIDRIRKAGQWLLSLYDPKTGRMPNLGSNDGALILPWSICDYQDYRPTIQAVGMVVDGKRWLPEGKWDDLAEWLCGVVLKEKDSEQTESSSKSKNSSPALTPSGSQITYSHSVPENNRAESPAIKYFSKGGYAVFSSDRSKLIFRCPKRFYHRPSQCDLLHVDLWFDGINVLRDTGTYSYNAPMPWQTYFKSTRAHNTIHVDNHEQMPQISRFLYGKWPIADVNVKNKQPAVSAFFINWKGYKHHRRVVSVSSGFNVIDTFSAFVKSAVLRWHLAPDLEWKESNNNSWLGNGIEIKIESDGSPITCTLRRGWEALYYMEKTPIPVLETALPPGSSQVTTQIRFL